MTRHTVRLRPEALDAFPSVHAAARAVGLTPPALWRIVKGKSGLGPVTIGSLIHGTGQPFDELFDVVPLDGEK